MKVTLTRLFTVMMLIIVSMAAGAQVKVLFGEKGDDKFKSDGDKIEVAYDGGTIVVTQKAVDANNVTVYLAVTPSKGYTMQEKDVIEAYAVVPADINPTRALTVSEKLTLKCDNFKDESSSRTYHATIDSKLALWVKSADFQKKRDGAKAGIVSDGIYYIRNNSNSYGYLWPSITTNSTTGYRYLTTSLDVKADAVVNNNGVSYPAHDKSYSHWVVKNVTGGYIQLINPRLNKYVVLRKFPKENNTNENAYGDRDVWLTDEPAAEDIEYTYFVLNNDNAPYKISPKAELNNVSNTSGYTFNSAAGSDRVFLTWSKTDGKPYTGEGRDGLIQIYSGGTPLWSFTSNLLDAPTISDVDPVSSKVTVLDNNDLPSGYNVRYTFSSDGTTIPDATSDIMPSDGLPITEDGVLKVVIERYGVVLTSVASKNLEPSNKCAKPVIAKGDHVFTITCDHPTTGVTIYYTTDSETTEEQLAASPTTYGTAYPAGGVSFTDYDFTVKAIATGDGYINSAVAVQYIGEDLTGEGTEDSPYLIRSDKEFSTFVGSVNSGDGASKHYKLMANISGGAEIIQPFTGVFEGGIDDEGNFYKISGLRHALFNSLNGGTVKNVMLDNVNISVVTNAGAICNEATGASRIYNCGVLASDSDVETDDDGYTSITDCSSKISGGTYVGGVVGLLDGTSRVINCFSYANIIGGGYVGGIVGWNNVATTSANLATMVMNCMFYGDITGGTSIAPIYNGEIITNRSDQNGVSNFNYFWAGASYVQDQNIDVYNCALSAETRFLQRFEFFRLLLNSNRALAAWWATDSRDNKNEMLKWVMEPLQIGTSTPYPILKNFARYPSIINIDAANATTFDDTDKNLPRNKGRKFGTLTINIQNGSGGPTTGANITTTRVTPNITDKDPDHFNFNYYKVQLPYYNDVGSGNYTQNKVVTGWKIVSVDGSGYGTQTFSKGTMPADATATVTDGDITLTTPYNYADRKCTQKDVYETNDHRIFNQGAYFDVPEGVTTITIEPYWAKCVYVSDQYPDVVYNQTMSNNAVNVTTVGGGVRFTNNTAYDINGSSQKVYTSMSNAVTALNPSGSVYDNAIVLVGNVHGRSLSSEASDKPYTIMSIDLDEDNEPDYSYILRFDGRTRVHPVRVDFLNVIGLGMAQKSNDGEGTYNLGILQPLDWFEVTNTGLFRVTQFEYDYDGREMSPIILQGGVIEQWVTVGGREESIVAANAVNYYHVGGNVWFKEFHIGVHQDKIQTQFVSPHPPISVTGGDYDILYLTGYYNSPNNNYDDNAECYINGGRFGKVAGTGMQGIGAIGGEGKGNIIWQIDNADIDEFYAGGMNAAHIAEGNIYTVITNSRVDLFCGGPKFGDMNSGKIVVTNATNCTFRTFFGAGYGGNSYNRRYPLNRDNIINTDWNAWVSSEHQKRYNATYKGVEARIDYQFIPRSSNSANVARLFVDHVSFSLATTCDVTSKLTGCTITTRKLGRLKLFDQCLGNFYGGGSLGKVTGPVRSTLTNCTVEGNVFGAGYSATLPTVNVMKNSFKKEPEYDSNLGAYLEAELPDTEAEYKWKPLPTGSTTYVDNTNHILYAKAEDLKESNLGSVNGDVTLTLTTSGTNGKTTIGVDSDNTTGNVYGGGDASYVLGASNKIIVNLQGNTQVLRNVYGGGNKGLVEGSTEVNIE